MNVPLLIDAIVRQVTVLIAQLATAGGVRAPLAHIANQVFVELANELAAQGVSRKVSADMFGMALRAYLRKVRRLNESSTEHGLTLWKAVLDYLAETPRSRDEVIARFHRDDETQLRAVLHDLTDSGLVYASGASNTTLYRRRERCRELPLRMRQLSAADRLEQLVWVLIYREGPIEAELLARRLRMSLTELEVFVRQLGDSGHITREQRDGSTFYEASDFSGAVRRADRLGKPRSSTTFKRRFKRSRSACAADRARRVWMTWWAAAPIRSTCGLATRSRTKCAAHSNAFASSTVRCASASRPHNRTCEEAGRF